MTAAGESFLGQPRLCFCHFQTKARRAFIERFGWNGGEDWTGIKESQDDSVWNYLEAGERGCGLRIADILAGKNSRLTGFSWVETAGKRLLRLDFDRLLTDVDEYCRGFAILDPSNRWAVVNWSISARVATGERRKASTTVIRP